MKAIVLLWLWWNERNAVQEGDKPRSPEDLAFVISHTATKFLDLHTKETTVTAGPPPGWRRPPRDVLKINSDGSFTAKTGTGGWVFFIRAAAGKLGNLKDALTA